MVLLVDRAEALKRFDRRPDETAWHVHNRRMVAHQGGPGFLGAMYDRLLAVVQERPAAMVVPSDVGGADDTYAAVERAVVRRLQEAQR